MKQKIMQDIINFITSSETYPTMKGLLKLHLTYSGRDIFYLEAISELQEQHYILYDHKHDSWIYIVPNTSDQTNIGEQDE